jgi:hypothetical protein
MIQIPEATSPNSEARNQGYDTISAIGKERIRKVVKKIQNESDKQLPLGNTKKDLGVKVLRYTSSNFKQWQPIEARNPETLSSLFDNMSDPLIQGWKKEDLLTEILLLEGFPLTSKITYLEDLLQNQVYCVNAPDFCAHDLFVCLDEFIQPDTVKLLTMEKEDIFICLDSALSDELKARVQDQFNVHVI